MIIFAALAVFFLVKLSIWMMMATMYLFIVLPFKLIVGIMDRA